MGGQALIRLQTVEHAFLGRTVLRGIDLHVSTGEMVALVGPSGCGKSTLAQIAIGLITPKSGHIQRDYHRHGVVFQEPRLLPWATAAENIAYPLPRSGRDQTVAKVARQVALEQDDLLKYPVELSGGMRQRVAIARALAMQPDMIFFDEPFTALDVALKRRMQDLVIAACVGKRMGGLFITHDLMEAARVADRIAVMHAGGRGIVGQCAAPKGDDATQYAWVQRALHENPLFRHIHDVDERRLA